MEKNRAERNPRYRDVFRVLWGMALPPKRKLSAFIFMAGVMVINGIWKVISALPHGQGVRIVLTTWPSHTPKPFEEEEEETPAA